MLNFRRCKRLEKKLVKNAPSKDNKASRLSVDWHFDNETIKYIGLKIKGIFEGISENYGAILLRDEEKYRLLIIGTKEYKGILLIEDIDEFLEKIGVEIAEVENKEEFQKALEVFQDSPSTGILCFNNGELRIYEYANK